MAWRMLGMDKKWKLWDKWEAWWKDNDLKGVSKDTWNMLIFFIEKLGDDVSNYNEDGKIFIVQFTCPNL